jgi:hypothetical protein
LKIPNTYIFFFKAHGWGGAGGVAQVVGPEFKIQYKKKERLVQGQKDDILGWRCHLV